MECPNCRLINPDTAERCDCGYSFKAQKMSVTDADDNPPPTYCINCGAKAKVIAKFCHVCGLPIYRGTSSEIPLPSPSQPFPPIATPVLDWYLATATPVLDWYLAPWKKYAVFTGRARRKEFWLFNLGNLIIALVLILSEGLFGIAAKTDESVLAALFQLAILVPSLAVAVRRMHDIDCSGWMGFVPLFNLFFACVNGTRGANRFGADPKAAMS